MSRCSCRLRGEIVAILAVLSLLQAVTMVAQDVLRQRTPGALTMSYDLALGATFPVVRDEPYTADVCILVDDLQ